MVVGGGGGEGDDLVMASGAGRDDGSLLGASHGLLGLVCPRCCFFVDVGPGVGGACVGGVGVDGHRGGEMVVKVVVVLAVRLRVPRGAGSFARRRCCRQKTVHVVVTLVSFRRLVRAVG